MTEIRLDLRGLKCPLPVLRTRKALAARAPGDTLIVECTDPLAAIDIPSLAQQSGDAVLDMRNEAGLYTFRIRKGVSRA